MKSELRYPLGILALAFMVCSFDAHGAEKHSLAERLGYKTTDKLLIVNGDDVGMCHAANLGTIECLEKGAMRSATMMVPCPWFLEIADYAKAHPEKDFGIHLCHTSEWKKYRWGPVADREKVAGLCDPLGYLWPEVPEVYAHATPEQALLEGRAQIQRALAAGVDVTHLDSHMGTLQYDPRYLKAYVQLGVEFDLPLRMASQETMSRHGHPELRDQIAAQGIVFTDYFVQDELKEEQSKGVKPFWIGVVKDLKPGVTELYIHAAQSGDELKAITGSWRTRSEQYELFAHDEDMKQLLKEQKVILIGYRPLRELQRRERREAAGK